MKVDQKKIHAEFAAPEMSEEAHDLLQSLLRTGLGDTVHSLQEMRPGLRARDYRAIAEQLAWARRPLALLNHHDRRARLARQEQQRRQLDRMVEQRLPFYEQFTTTLTPEGKKAYDARLKLGPKASSPWAPHALDTAEVAELRRSMFEIDVAVRMHNAQARVHRMFLQRAKKEARREAA